MKITLAVVFLAGLTIYCKCTSVLSLPPSLIARAASLEKSETPKAASSSSNNEGDSKNNKVEGTSARTRDEQQQQDAEAAAAVVADTAEFYKNFKNLWHKNFNVQKREHSNFEDDIAAVVAAPQSRVHQQQLLNPAIAAIKNQQNALQQFEIMQQQPQDNRNNNNILKMKTSASSFNGLPNERQQHQQQMPQLPVAIAVAADDEDDDVAAEEYDSNEWLAPSSKMTDDIIVSPPLTQMATTLDEDDDDDNRAEIVIEDDGDNNNNNHNEFEPQEIATPLREASTYEIATSSAAAGIDDSPMPPESMKWNKFLRPLKYWAKQCQSENENNCPEDYYRALIADRNNAILKQIQHKESMLPYYNPITFDLMLPQTPAELSGELKDAITAKTRGGKPQTFNDLSEDDIVLLMTAEQNLVQFLSWAMSQLYPFGKFANVTENGADSYYPGMFLWKKLNLSGRIEPPLLVEEPHYVIVRREYDPDEDLKRGLHLSNDPFIPPRGRKHNLPDLDALLQRYEPFVPNRGRRDKIKDIFKHDDLFYPNRGKRQMMLPATGSGGNDDIKAYQHQLQRSINAANVDQAMMAAAATQLQQYPLTATLQRIKNVMAKMKRKLQQQQNIANSFDEMSSNIPMSSTYQPSQERINKRLKSMANMLQQQRRQPNGNRNTNARRHWWKRYSTDRPANIGRSRSATTNRVHVARSMSPLPQLTDLAQQQNMLQATQYLAATPTRFGPARKFMWQQQMRPQQQYEQRAAAAAATPSSSTSSATRLQSLAQQFDPLSWHKLPMFQQQHHLPLLTMRQPSMMAAKVTSAATDMQHLQPPLRRQHQLQHQLQLATPQETQLSSYLYDSADDGLLSNDLQNLFNTDDD